MCHTISFLNHAHSPELFVYVYIYAFRHFYPKQSHPLVSLVPRSLVELYFDVFISVTLLSFIHVSCLQKMQRDKKYLDIIGKPEEIWIRVLHSEENVASRNDLPLGNCFDTDWKTAIVFLTQLKEEARWLLSLHVFI